MRRNYWAVILVLGLSAAAADADEANRNTAIGSIGEAVEAVIGAEIADRDGALLAARGTPPSIAFDAPTPEVSTAPPDSHYTLVVRPEVKYCAPGKGDC